MKERKYLVLSYGFRTGCRIGKASKRPDWMLDVWDEPYVQLPRMETHGETHCPTANEVMARDCDFTDEDGDKLWWITPEQYEVIEQEADSYLNPRVNDAMPPDWATEPDKSEKLTLEASQSVTELPLVQAKAVSSAKYWVVADIYFCDTRKDAELIAAMRDYDDTFDYSFGWDSSTGPSDIVERTATPEEEDELIDHQLDLNICLQHADEAKERILEYTGNNTSLRFRFIPGE